MILKDMGISQTTICNTSLIPRAQDLVPPTVTEEMAVELPHSELHIFDGETDQL